MWAASVTVVSDDFPLPTIAFVLLATVVNQYARFFPEAVSYTHLPGKHTVPALTSVATSEVPAYADIFINIAAVNAAHKMVSLFINPFPPSPLFYNHCIRSMLICKLPT